LLITLAQPVLTTVCGVEREGTVGAFGKSEGQVTSIHLTGLADSTDPQLNGTLIAVAHIELGNELPGIRGLLAYRPETAQPLMHLAEVLLRGDSTLSRGERELIAAYVSRGNDCEYCAGSHGASAAALLPGGTDQVAKTLAGASCDAPVSAKMRALLEIASLVRLDARLVSEQAVAAARAEGATDREIHDTVLIAAAFCMFNRYVDGLATPVPDDPVGYEMSAAHLVKHGYQVPR
jgi:uncharacterized peroxidase-related enzyme